MSAVNVLAVRILNNPAKFLDPFAFEIEYEALVPLADDLEWQVIYVGSADSDQCDQTLESIFVGPVTAGSFKFVLETNPPDPARIPADDLLGVTVILLTCSYRGKEFIRVGYYVNVEVRRAGAVCCRKPHRGGEEPWAGTRRRRCSPCARWARFGKRGVCAAFRNCILGSSAATTLRGGARGVHICLLTEQAIDNRTVAQFCRSAWPWPPPT